MKTHTQTIGPVQPWWRFGIVWLAFGGPAVVVVAALVTLVIAIDGADRPVVESTAAQTAEHAPATQARNHAASPRR